MAYNIIFYEKKDGTAPVWDFLENLRTKSLTSKDARIQFMYYYIPFAKRQIEHHVAK